jgi:riboflavin biosynthesis pyrimidine reductase
MRILLLLMITAVGCIGTTPKEVIVERQKEIRREQKILRDSAAANVFIFTDSTKDEDIKNSKEVQFLKRVNQLEQEYDSLEIELKKY